MEKIDPVSEYIEKSCTWKAELVLLRELCLEAGFTETVKWGIPTYTINKKNVVGIAGFKSYVGLWFFNGVFLSDPYRKLINAQKGTTKGLLQWRFEHISEIIPSEISEYLAESIANEKAGLKIKSAQNKPLKLDPKLEKALSLNPDLHKAFEAFSPFKKREFSDYITGAKRETTKIKRLEKCQALILSGVGLHDKYR